MTEKKDPKPKQAKNPKEPKEEKAAKASEIELSDKELDEVAGGNGPATPDAQNPEEIVPLQKTEEL